MNIPFPKESFKSLGLNSEAQVETAVINYFQSLKPFIQEFLLGEGKDEWETMYSKPLLNQLVEESNRTFTDTAISELRRYLSQPLQFFIKDTEIPFPKESFKSLGLNSEAQVETAVIKYFQSFSPFMQKSLLGEGKDDWKTVFYRFLLNQLVKKSNRTFTDTEISELRRYLSQPLQFFVKDTDITKMSPRSIILNEPEKEISSEFKKQLKVENLPEIPTREFRFFQDSIPLSPLNQITNLLFYKFPTKITNQSTNSMALSILNTKDNLKKYRRESSSLHGQIIGPSGCGKTRSILEILSNYKGVYIECGAALIFQHFIQLCEKQDKLNNPTSITSNLGFQLLSYVYFSVYQSTTVPDDEWGKWLYYMFYHQRFDSWDPLKCVLLTKDLIRNPIENQEYYIFFDEVNTLQTKKYKCLDNRSLSAVLIDCIKRLPLNYIVWISGTGFSASDIDSRVLSSILKNDTSVKWAKSKSDELKVVKYYKYDTQSKIQLYLKKFPVVPNFSQMKVGELKKFLKLQGETNYSTLKKAQLVERCKQYHSDLKTTIPFPYEKFINEIGTRPRFLSSFVDMLINNYETKLFNKTSKEIDIFFATEIDKDHNQISNEIANLMKKHYNSNSDPFFQHKFTSLLFNCVYGLYFQNKNLRFESDQNLLDMVNLSVCSIEKLDDNNRFGTIEDSAVVEKALFKHFKNTSKSQIFSQLYSQSDVLGNNASNGLRIETCLGYNLFENIQQGIEDTNWTLWDISLPTWLRTAKWSFVPEFQQRIGNKTNTLLDWMKRDNKDLFFPKGGKGCPGPDCVFHCESESRSHLCLIQIKVTESSSESKRKIAFQSINPEKLYIYSEESEQNSDNNKEFAANFEKYYNNNPTLQLLYDNRADLECTVDENSNVKLVIGSNQAFKFLPTLSQYLERC